MVEEELAGMKAERNMAWEKMRDTQQAAVEKG